MDEVFLNEDLNGQVDWETVDVAGEVSLVPSSLENETDFFIVQLDLNSRLKTLKNILAHRLGVTLSHYELWLQDSVQLDEETTLSQQCIQGEGMVQVNLELKTVENTDRINILDVLKPPAEDTSTVSVETQEDVHDSQTTLQESVVQQTESVCKSDSSAPAKEPQRNLKVNGSQNTTVVSEIVVSASHSKSTTVLPIKSLNGNSRQTAGENITRWVMDSSFRKDQDRLKIPLDPALWTQAQVQFWIVWAINQFNLKEVYASQWISIDGPALCNMSHSEFTQKIANDPNDLFWTHLELLRKCKFVGVIQKPVPYLQYVTTPLKVVKQDAVKVQQTINKPIPTLPKGVQSEASGFNGFGISANRTSNSGQVQLWQFLLELLTDKNFRDAISWLGTGGEFKLNNPEMVAQLWGERKNKPHMNYEKLSRALRYYYDGDMICKVNGKRFVYKFVCDLKQILGYSADELNKLVIECAQKSNAKRATTSIL